MKRAADLTSQLLAFSRRGKYVSEPVDVHKLVVEVADMLALKVDATIQIEASLDAVRSIVLGDSSQLGSAILNLAINAIDAMPHGGKLTFRTRNTHLDETFAATTLRVATDDYLQLTVTDTGVGYRRGHATPDVRALLHHEGGGRGTGLGLAAVYGMIQTTKGRSPSRVHRDTGLASMCSSRRRPAPWSSRCGPPKTWPSHTRRDTSSSSKTIHSCATPPSGPWRAWATASPRSTTG